MSSILERWRALKGKLPASAQLMVVSKGQSQTDILPLLQAGQRLFGENRVQEATTKWPELRVQFPDVKLHGIGRLQTNKVGEALKLFDALHSLDRPSLAKALAKHQELFRPGFFVLIQVNVAREPQKAGVLPEEFEEFYQLCQSLHLPVQGLMTLPPQGEDPTPFFQSLASLASSHALPILSMGMSQDYVEALACGATIIRVGSGIFQGNTNT